MHDNSGSITYVTLDWGLNSGAVGFSADCGAATSDCGTAGCFDLDLTPFCCPGSPYT